MADESDADFLRRTKGAGDGPSTSGGESDADFLRRTNKLPGNIDPLTMQPYQFVGVGRGPVAESTGKPIREDQVPGASIQAAGSMATDPEQRRRIIAGQLFPKLSPGEAQDRVFYGTNGRLAAVGLDGQAFYVDPTPYAPDVNQPSSLIPNNLLPRVGTYAGPALPATGAIVGGAVASPASVVLGPLAAGAGAATGDVMRQQLAGKLDPGAPPPQGAPPGTPPTTVPYNWRQTAAEAVGAGTGQLIGGMLVRGFTPNPLGANAFDLRAIQTKELQDKAREAYARAEAQGVHLTPGQASGLPSVLNLEDVYTSGTAGPQGANIAERFYAGQRPQLTNAFDAAMNRVSPTADSTDAALQFQHGAEDASRLVRQQGNALARPSYQAAESSGQVMSPDLAQLSDLPAMQDALKAAAKDYHNLTGRVANIAAPDFQLWNLAKTKLDDAWNAAKRAGENTTAMAVDNIRQRLLTNLDAAYPTYGQARAVTAPFQRQAARLESGVGGATGDGTETARGIVNKVFGPNANNPRAIAEFRDSFIQTGRGDEWNAGVRAYVQDLFDGASRSQEGLNPSTLLRQVWSDPRRRAVMQAAMDPQAFAGFERFMQTLQDVAQSRGMNSLTAQRLAGGNALNEAAASTGGVRAVGLLKGLSPFQLLDAPAKGITAIQNWMIRRNVDRIGEYLFSPNGMEYLRTMGRLPPGSRAIAATARFLGERGGAAVAPYLSEKQPNALLAVP